MLDLSRDFVRIADGVEAVTILRPGSVVRMAVPHALHQGIRMGEAADSDGRYLASDVVWHLPFFEFDAAPRPGDVILDAREQRWTMLDVRRTTLDTRWRCVARNLAIAHGLDDVIEIDKATYEKGQGGAATPVWRTWRSGVRARIPPVESGIERRADQAKAADRCTVFIADELMLGRDHRLRAADGTLYAVRGWRKAQRIDALIEIDAERISA